jgi:serine/threonine-protein phosphatase 2A regulatory subunit B
MENRPIRTIYVHEQLRSKLCDLYENDAIFDKFQCSFSGDNQRIMTGSYHNYFHVYDRNGKQDRCIEASKTPKKKPARAMPKLKGKASPAKDDEGETDLDKKVMSPSFIFFQLIFIFALLPLALATRQFDKLAM